MKVSDLPWNFLDSRKSADESLVLKPGQDDCSVVKSAIGYSVYTTDFINSNPAALSLGVGTLSDLGYLAVISNISDLIGSGAIPTGMLVGIQLGEDDDESSYFSIMDGALEALDLYGVPLLGGDTKKGLERAIYGVGIGFSESHESLFLACRAKTGDKIMVSGELGAFNAAVYALTKSNKKISSDLYQECVKAIVRPKLNIDLSRRLAKTGESRGGTDISDGLGSDLIRMAEISGVGLKVNAESIPLAPLAQKVAEIFKVDPYRFVFATGGDWQFAVTGDPIDGAIVIGEVTGSDYLLQSSNGIFPLPSCGHDDGGGFRSFSQEIVDIVDDGVEY